MVPARKTQEEPRQEERLTSEEVAQRLGLSYPKLMRLLRAGFVQPEGYKGSRRTPVCWTPHDVQRALFAYRLEQINLEPERIPEILDKYWEVFAAGYEPLWVVDRYDERGEAIGRAISLRHPKDEGKGREVFEHEGTALVRTPAYYLDIERFPPRKGTKSKGTWRLLAEELKAAAEKIGQKEEAARGAKKSKRKSGR